ncbi:MAG TPA: hypothetical protein PK819_13275, partial [Thermomicrobiales bacterium]|nr:hypothetical protein [Thermomicrobiales bacterium]
MAGNIETDLARLRELLGEVNDLDHAAAVISWDQNVMMPSGGSEARGAAMETLAKIRHDRFTSAEVGQLADRLGSWAATQPEASIDRALVERTAYDWDRERRVPSQLAGDLAAFEAVTIPIWLDAREKRDYKLFAPSLAKAIDLKRRVIDCFEQTAS